MAQQDELTARVPLLLQPVGIDQVGIDVVDVLVDDGRLSKA
jgi:hypothetical protein